MYTRILVPLDGSPMAEQVLPYVRLLASSFQAPVYLLRTVSPLPLGAPDPTQDRYRAEVLSGLSTDAAVYLSSIKDSLEDLDLPISQIVYEGNAASAIMREAEPEGTLIIMSTHGRSGLGRWVLGSVTDEVLHTTDKPVLVVRSKEEKAFIPQVGLSTVVVPLDGSSEAEQVLPHVVTLAKALNLFALLFRVTSAPLYYGHEDYPSAAYQKLLEATDVEAKEYLHRVAEGLRQQGVTVVGERVEHGSVPTAIEDLVKNQPDVIVALASHGRGGFERLVMGGVADHLVRRSGDPVLVVPRRGVRERVPVQAHHLMSTPVVTISEGASIAQATQTMLDRNVSCLPVVNPQGRLVGMLTHTDFDLHPRLLSVVGGGRYAMLGSSSKPGSLEEAAREVRTKEVKEVMKSPVVTIQEDTPVSEIAELMLRRGVHRLPVMRGADIIGIITRHDLLKLMATHALAVAGA